VSGKNVFLFYFYSLIELCGCDIESEEFDSEHLNEPEARQLILHIAR
jgi:hypothetical protein